MTFEQLGTFLLYSAVALLPVLLHETWLDLRAARPLRNGRLAMARVSMVRIVALTGFVVTALVIRNNEVRRLAFAGLIFVLAVTEVYRRRALRESQLMPAWWARLWLCVTRRPW